MVKLGISMLIPKVGRNYSFGRRMFPVVARVGINPPSSPKYIKFSIELCDNVHIWRHAQFQGRMVPAVAYRCLRLPESCSD